MGDEVEKKYLLGKLNELIQQVDLAKMPLPSQISQLNLKFERLKNILEKELKSTKPRISREKLYNITNLLCEWKSKQLSPFSPESVCFAPRCATMLESILEELEKQSDDRDLQSHVIPAEGAYRWSNQFMDTTNIVGRKEKEVLLRSLILPQPNFAVFRMFGLVGIEGSGKSTLARLVFEHPDIKKHYITRLWVCVSKQPSEADQDPKKELVRRILTSLGVEDEIIKYVDTNYELKGLLCTLRQQLLGKRYLIVLDDVYIDDNKYLEYISDLDKNTICEEKLAYGLPKKHGGAIIVTSWSKKIASKIVREENLHINVLPLSEDDTINIILRKEKEVLLRSLILPQPNSDESSDDAAVFRMFGLVGMRGIGKSTLARLVLKHQDIKNHYLPRLWACVSKQPFEVDQDPKKEIVRRILASLGVEDEIIKYVDTNHKLKGLLCALRQQLLGKRYLIVLDDVYIEDDEYLEYISNLDKNTIIYEEKLAYGLPKEHGGAIIVTSRNRKIASKIVGEENVHNVLPLSEDDCWEIFKYIYEEEEEEKEKMSADIESLKNKIKEKCHGLPLAAKMMGEIARKQKRKKPNVGKSVLQMRNYYLTQTNVNHMKGDII